MITRKVIVNRYSTGDESCRGGKQYGVICKKADVKLSFGNVDITAEPTAIQPIQINRAGYGYSVWVHTGLEAVYSSSSTIGNIKWYCNYDGNELDYPISVAVASAVQNATRLNDTYQPLSMHSALVSGVSNVLDVRGNNALSVPGTATPNSKGQFSNLVVLQAYATGKYGNTVKKFGPNVPFVWTYDES